MNAAVRGPAHAKTIPGWMEDDELEWLAAQAAGRDLVVEFGAWCGRSSVALATARLVLCVDTWRGSREHAELVAAGFNPWEQWSRNTAAYDNVAPFEVDLGNPAGVDDLVGIVTDAGGADMVFIDAAHDAPSVRRDIATARRLLRPGGLLCGHDYSDCWPGVKQAVDELVPGRGLTRSIWWAPTP
jgi:predicted O-methyltransferase YrrM